MFVRTTDPRCVEQLTRPEPGAELLELRGALAPAHRHESGHGARR